MKTLFGMSDIQTQVEQWGLWARGGLGGLALRVSEPTAIDISDDEALRFDRFVLSLRQYDSKAFVVIKRHYVVGVSLVDIAKELGCSYPLIKTKHKNALNYLAGMQNGYSAGAFGELNSLTFGR